MYLCIERRETRERNKSYFNELAHVSLEVGMTEIYRAGRQAGDPGRDGFAGPSWGHLEQNSFFLRGTSVLLLRSSNDWMRRPATQRSWSALLDDLNVNLILKTASTVTWVGIWPNNWERWSCPELTITAVNRQMWCHLPFVAWVHKREEVTFAYVSKWKLLFFFLILKIILLHVFNCEGQ